MSEGKSIKTLAAQPSRLPHPPPLMALDAANEKGVQPGLTIEITQIEKPMIESVKAYLHSLGIKFTLQF